MKVDKISFKDGQAWISIRSTDNEYLGTWHVSHPGFVEELRLNIPKTLYFGTKEGEQK